MHQDLILALELQGQPYDNILFAKIKAHRVEDSRLIDLHRPPAITDAVAAGNESKVKATVNTWLCLTLSRKVAREEDMGFPLAPLRLGVRQLEGQDSVICRKIAKACWISSAVT